MQKCIFSKLEYQDGVFMGLNKKGGKIISQAAAAGPERCSHSPTLRRKTGSYHSGPEITALASCEPKDRSFKSYYLPTKH